MCIRDRHSTARRLSRRNPAWDLITRVTYFWHIAASASWGILSPDELPSEEDAQPIDSWQIAQQLPGEGVRIYLVGYGAHAHPELPNMLPFSKSYGGMRSGDPQEDDEYQGLGTSIAGVIGASSDDDTAVSLAPGQFCVVDILSNTSR